MKTSTYIPREKFNLWYSLFKKRSGRLIGNPIDGNNVYVNYRFDNIGDCNDFEREYNRLTTNIVEKNRGLFKKIKARLNFLYFAHK